MVRKILFLAILLITGGLILSSCTKEEELSSKKEILAFVFEASKNAELELNVVGTITGTDVNADVPFGTATTSLVPAIEISPRATISPASGVAVDFSGPVTYTVTAEDGTTKQFIISVTVEPAPYIGTWTGGPIDFGVGLVHIKLTINELGETTLELKEILTSETSDESIKGVFDPLSEPNSDVLFTQTHRWVGNSWRAESEEHTILYNFDNAPKMRFNYCICYPRQEWWFQIDLSKE